jgi:hypothetical protein
MRTFTCQNKQCLYQFCPHCLTIPHPGLNCEEYQQKLANDDAEKKTMEFIK